jgi:hypothetical protein
VPDLQARARALQQARRGGPPASRPPAWWRTTALRRRRRRCHRAAAAADRRGAGGSSGCQAGGRHAGVGGQVGGACGSARVADGAVSSVAQAARPPNGQKGVGPRAEAGWRWLQVAVDPALGGAEGGAVPRRLEAAGADVRARAEAQGAEHPGGLHQQRVRHGPARSVGVRLAAASSRPGLCSRWLGISLRTV